MTQAAANVTELSFNPETPNVDWYDTINFVVDEIGMEEINDMFESFSYQGFDPIMIRKLALQYAEGGIKPIVQLISLSLRQGTNTQRFEDTLSNEGKAMFKALSNKFKLSAIDGSRRRVPRQVLTIQRLQASFPEIVAAIIIMMWKRRKFVPIGATEDQMKNTPWLFFPSAGSIIPRADTSLFERWREWNKNFSRIINRRRKDVDLTNQSDFEEIIHESPLFSEEQRREIIQKLTELDRNI